MAIKKKKPAEKHTGGAMLEKIPTPKPNGLFGYRSMSEKSIQKTVDLHTTMLIACILICVMSVVLGIINLFMIKNISNNPYTATLDDWVECELDNHIGYKVRKDWKTSGYDGSVIFQPTDTTAISVGSQSIADINRAHTENLLTHDTLKQYIENDLKAVDSDENFAIRNITCDEYITLGTTGYRYTFTQDTQTENQKVATYTESVFFIYEDYLYTFSYTSAVMGYAIPEFEFVLDSIRLIPESERPTLLPSQNFNSDIADDYTRLGESLTSNTSSSSVSSSDTTPVKE